MNKFYTSSEYLQENPDYHLAHSPWKAKKIKEILRQLNLEFYGNVVEVGCGVGGILENLNKDNKGKFKAIGYDISPIAIDLARKRCPKSIEFKCIDFLKEEDLADFLILADVFEHVEDYIGFLKKIKSRSKYFIFHIPLDLSILSILRNFPILQQRAKVGHLHHFITDTALETLKLSGFELVAWDYTPVSIDLLNYTTKEKLANLARKTLQFFSKKMAATIMGGYSLIVLTK